VTRNEYTVAAGRIADYEARQARFLEFLKAQAGFQAGFLLNSLGYPYKYVRLARWESREAQRAFAKSKTLSDYLKANPNDGSYTPGGPQQAYEVIAIFDGDGEAKYAGLVDWTIQVGSAAAWENNRKALFELRKKHLNGKGWVSSRLARFLGAPGRYTILNLFSSPDGFAGGDNVPAIQEFTRANPTTEMISAPGVQERFEIVMRV